MITVTDLGSLIQFDVDGVVNYLPKNNVRYRVVDEIINFYSGDVLIGSANWQDIIPTGVTLNDVVTALNSIFFLSSRIGLDDYSVFVGVRTGSLEQGTMANPFSTFQAAIDYLVANPPPNPFYRIVHLGGSIPGNFTIPDNWETVFIEGCTTSNAANITPDNVILGTMEVEANTYKTIFLSDISFDASSSLVIDVVGTSSVGFVIQGCVINGTNFINSPNPLALFIFANSNFIGTAVNFSVTSGGFISFLQSVSFGSAITLTGVGGDVGVTMTSFNKFYGVPAASLTLENIALTIKDSSVASIAHNGVSNPSTNAVIGMNVAVGDLDSYTVGNATLTDGNYKFINSFVNVIPNSAIEL